MAQAIVQRACAKLRSAIDDEAVRRFNFTGDLREMLEALEAVQPVLELAELVRFRNTLVLEMVHYVLDAAYKTIDAVDDLQVARTHAAAKTMMTGRLLPRLAIMKNVMAIQVQDMKRQVMMIHEKFHVLSIWVLGMLQEFLKERKSGPVFEGAMVLGRALDKERIIAVLRLSDARNVRKEHITIFPIFGFGGIGKTTLAQMVFNDTHSLQGYDFRVWVHVSPHLDFQAIGMSIIFHVTGTGQEEITHSSSDVEGMESIMKRLHKLLNGKKVLLVLDDLWEEDPIQLQLLKSMLTFLGDKMDVIVTTCNQAIARKICTVEPYRLDRLSDDTCWEIIKKSIDFEEEGEEEMEKIGWEIASMCWGVPWAAQRYAGMLGSSRDTITWKAIIDRKLLLNISTDDSQFPSAVSTFELSYVRMPPDLRLCFAYYCEIFPASHSIVKDDLVHHWIALQLIEPSEILSATEIAEEYITRLQDLSFLQIAKSNHVSAKDDKGEILFTMQNLVHDLARNLAGGVIYCLYINHNGELDASHDECQRALHCVGCSKVKFSNGTFSRKKCLRVLELKESAMRKLPDSICQLRHLGYLKISEFTGLVTLPESFGHLTNLFHVDLSGCSKLLNLPESFGKLTRLVHANLSGCSELLNLPVLVGKLVNLVHINLSGCCGLASLPESFGDLINLAHVNLSRCHGLAELPEPLQKLGKLVHLDLSFWSCFKGIGKGLGGLTNLEHLNLSSPCCHLAQHRSHLQELKDGLCKLTKLRYLNLSMCLNPIFYQHRSQEDSPQYIGECVSGLSNLEHLDLSYNTFIFGLPASLGELNKLYTLDLSGCIRLKKVGDMKSLKFLDLRKCRGLESCHFVVRVVDDEDAYSSSNIVQLEGVNCQELQISCLEKVKSTVEAQMIKLEEKQKLEKLKLSWTVDSLGRVEDSALLGELVPPSNLQCLEVNGYSGTCLPEFLRELTSLRELKIVCCKQLNSLPVSIQNLTSVKHLCIFGCPELEKWCQLDENKKMLAHISNINYEEPASTSRTEIEEDARSIDEVDAA